MRDEEREEIARIIQGTVDDTGASMMGDGSPLIACVVITLEESKACARRHADSIMAGGKHD